MKKFVKKAFDAVFPYMFHGFLVGCLVDGSTNLLRVSSWTLSIFGLGYLVLGALLVVWHKETATWIGDNINNEEKVKREYWLSRRQRPDNLLLAWATCMIAVYADVVVPATIYIFGFMAVRTGVYLTKEYLKDNYVVE